MNQSSQIKTPRVDSDSLHQRAETIRDAVAPKSISARQVGELFFDITSACCDLSKALGLLISTDLPDIQSKIIRLLSTPLRVDIISAPSVITLGNHIPQQIVARLFPRFCPGSVLFVGDNDAVNISPDGFITPLRPGRSRIYAVATADTSVHEQIYIDIIQPRCRLAASGALRLDSHGNIRLT